ncbi:MAG: hypothetical protein KTV68_13305 [Acidimicrobiia bacterium]|nr:hypothetical protein [Acidimicrobiia bacterium]MCY4435550.1 hypothetical protein [bacterium]
MADQTPPQLTLVQAFQMLERADDLLRIAYNDAIKCGKVKTRADLIKMIAGAEFMFISKLVEGGKKRLDDLEGSWPDASP